jgi:hypothetical protein
MFANTKQIRKILRAAAKNVGAEVVNIWTDVQYSEYNTNNMRYVGIQVNDFGDAVAYEANKLAAAAGYTNTMHTTTGNCFIRTKAVLA